MHKLTSRFDTFTNRFDSLFKVIPGWMFGLLSVIIGLVGDFIAYLLFPGYNILEHMISDLGRGPGAVYYNVGVIIAGIVAIPFGICVGNTLNSEDVKDGTIRLAVLSYMISAITLSLSGVFPGFEDNNAIFFIHGLFAFISFTSAALYLAIFGFIMLKDDRYPNALAYYGFVILGLLILTVLTWLPIIEWSASFGVIIWTVIASFYLLHQEQQEP